MEEPQKTGSVSDQTPAEDNTIHEKPPSKESLKQKSTEKKLSIQSSKSNSIFLEKESVSLKEDVFGRYIDENGEEHLVYRYTWRNRNHIQIQVINYGARVTSIRLPDRRGEIEDIVLGFDDVAGYLFYDKHYFGAIIGRYTNVIQNGTFVLDKKMHTVSTNWNGHCFNGGHKGLDKMIWNTHISGKKVIMSHVSPHMTDGFPGDLLVRITFELSAKNEFKISMDAQSTCPTIINLSHLLYVNLAGHHKGPEEIYKHMLTMNCNCFTAVGDNNIPSSEILNVMHSPFDFQIPKLLGKVIGIIPKDGFNQNLCVNRGMYQKECFVGRLLHVPSGRMLEVYSNQPGVQLETGNEFGHGMFKSMEEIMKKQESKTLETILDPVMLVYRKVHDKVSELLELDKETSYPEIKDLLIKFTNMKKRESNSLTDFLNNGILLSDKQMEYLQRTKEIVCEDMETDNACLDLKEALSNILKVAKVEELKVRSNFKEESKILQNEISPSEPKIKESSLSDSQIHTKTKSDVRAISKTLFSSKLFREPSLKAASQKKFNTLSLNKIPSLYKTSDAIRGKAGAVYKMHGAVALQTQNYPNAVNFKNFPNSELRPGDVYKHDIVYRFWVRAGNPSKWVKRNQATKQCK